LTQFNYHHLYYFFVIAKEGGVAKAAVKLRLGQPTLSSQLKVFEDSLGKKLFERKNRSLILTDAGRITLEYARRIFDLGQEFLEVLNDKRGPELQHLQIGALDSIPKDVIFKLTEQAHATGDCFVSVHEGSSEFLIRELLAHRIDLAFMNTAIPSGPSSKFVCRNVGKLPVYVFGATKFKGSKKHFPASLEGQPFVVNTEHSKLRQDFHHYLETRNIRPLFIGESQDTALKKLILSSGRALAALPREVVGAELRNQQLVELGPLEGVFEEYWINTVGRVVKNTKTQKLIENFKISQA
jgi:LysR family transcriptional activator of nhaA